VAIEFEEIRSGVDFAFKSLVEDLDVSYYQYWKKGVSRPWLGCDLYPGDLLKSKVYFDTLHGFVYHLHAVLLENINSKQKIYDKDKKDKKGALTREARKALKIKEKSEEALAWPLQANDNLLEYKLDPIDWVSLQSKIKKELDRLARKEIDL